MAESASRQDEANSVFQLVTWAGQMDLSCLLRISCIGPTRKSCLFGKIINPLLTSMFGEHGCILASFSFPLFLTLTLSQPIKLGQYPAILTSHLVNNAYLQLFWMINQIKPLTETSLITAVHHLKPAATTLPIYFLTSQCSYVSPPLKCKFLSKQS